MIIPASIQQKRSLIEPYLTQVAVRVRDVVATLCHDRGYAYLGRTKNPESLSEKIETGRFASWSELDDLFACAVVVPTIGEESSVIEQLQTAFIQVECKKRGSTLKDPAIFRFDITRFIGRLRPESVPSASEELLAIRFEVQVRTAFEHAWSETTHALAYKSSDVNWRHLRLAAQLRAAVEQLDQVVLGFEQTAAIIPEQSWPEVAARQRIWHFFSDKLSSKALPSEVVPKSWGRFSENLLQLIKSSSEKRITDLDSYVDDALKMIEEEFGSLTPDRFPRSISLLQFCTGAVTKRGLFKHPPHPQRFVPLITQELLDLFPETKFLGPGFDFQVRR